MLRVYLYDMHKHTLILELKTLPRFNPASLSLSMVKVRLINSKFFWLFCANYTYASLLHILLLKIHNIYQNFRVKYFDFVHFHYILLTFAFTLGDFKCYCKVLVLLGLIQNFWSFWLGTGKSWKSQYCRYLLVNKAGFST